MYALNHVEASSMEATIREPAGEPDEQSLAKVNDYSRVKRRPANQWTSNQRVVLAYLVWYGNDWRDITRIFNACFENELPTGDGLSQGAISAMSYCMDLNSDEEAALNSLKQSSSSANTVSFESFTRSSIAKIANILGITLIERQAGTSPRASRATKGSKTLSRKRKASALNTTTFSDDGDHTDANAHTPTKHHIQPPPNAYPTPLSSGVLSKQVKYSNPLTSALSPLPKHLNASITKKLAALGYRAFYPGSHTIFTGSEFRAGAFRDPIKPIPRAPAPDSQLYLENANLHVGKKSDCESFFISVTKNPMRAIHRALHLNSGRQTSIAIIDLRETERARKGSVMKAKALDLRPDCPYIAAGEYLIWGEIPSSAIISIVPLAELLVRIQGMEEDPFSIRVLQEQDHLYSARPIIESNTRNTVMSYRLGCSVGQLVNALRIPSIYLSDAVWSIIQDWKFKGSGDNGKENYKSNSSFKQGTQTGFEDNQSGNQASLDTQALGEKSRMMQDYQLEGIAIRSGRIGSPSALAHDQHFGDEFLIELQDAANDLSANVPTTVSNFPYKTALDVPEIKAEDRPHVDEDFRDGETGNNVEDELRRIAHTQLQADEIILEPGKTEGNYALCWTGM